MRLNGKMLLMLALLIAVAMTACLTGIIGLNNAGKQSSAFAGKDVAFLSSYKDIYALGLQRGQAVRNVLINPKDTKALDNFNSASSDSHKLMETLLAAAPDQGMDSTVLSTIQALTNQDIELQVKAISLSSSEPANAMKVIVDEETPVWREIKEHYFAGEQIVQSQFATKSTQLNQVINKGIIVLYCMVTIFVIGSVFILWYMRKVITQPVIAASWQVNQIAQGNLALPELAVSSSDEIGQLNRAINVMVQQLHTLINDVTHTSNVLASSSESLANMSNEASSAGQLVGVSVEALATGTETQMRGVAESSRAMEEMAVGIQRIAESSSEAADNAAIASKHAQDGQQLIGDASVQMTAIRSSVSQTAEEIDTLRLRSSEIGEIIDTIRDISTQTQLLALNASIEAARAGDAGRGFSIVASEVKKLAIQSEASAGKIGSIVSGVQEATRRAADAMERGMVDVGRGSSVVERASSAFTSILKDTVNVAEQIQEISAATEQMSASSEQITASMEDTANIAQEAYKGAQGAAEATVGQLKAIEQVALSAQELNQMAKLLRETVTRFTH